MTRRGALLLALGLLPACSGVQRMDEGAQVALLQVDCQPADAELYLDEHPMGALNRWRQSTIPLRPGAHRVEISKDGYHPYLMDLQAQPGRMYRLELDLLRDMDTLLDDVDEPASEDSPLSPVPAEALP